MLHELSNSGMTAFGLRRRLIQNVLLYGNGYAEIEWSGSGEWHAEQVRMRQKETIVLARRRNGKHWSPGTRAS